MSDLDDTPRGKPDSPSRKGSIGEPPPWVRYVVWLFDPENWPAHWKAIVVAAIVAVVGIPTVIPKFKQHRPPVRESSFLPDEEARLAITRALHSGDVERATNLVSALKTDAVKRDECLRVYAFLMKNRPEAAIPLVDVCWTSIERREKLADIERAGLKQ